MSQTYEQAVDKVVNWWADKSFGGKLNQNNGDNSEQGGLGFLLMNYVSLKAQDEVTEEKIQKFKSKLTELLLDPDTNKYYKHCIGVDYHPDMPLADACAHAGINTSCLPIKTNTWIQIYDGSNTVLAALGYHGKREELV